MTTRNGFHLYFFSAFFAASISASCFDGPATVRGLPLYPFQRQRYAATRSIESVEVIAPIDDHPLLGFRDPASPDAWMSHLCTASHPWLADHTVLGAVVLPASAFLELALYVGNEVGCEEVAELTLERPLVQARAVANSGCRRD